jgi:hypothetical protein
MRLFRFARRSSPWLRVLLAGLVLAFVLDSIAHLNHSHESDRSSVAHSVACGYCTTFGGLTEAPGFGEPVSLVRHGHVVQIAAFETVFDLRPLSAARPRGPPLS